MIAGTRKLGRYEIVSEIGKGAMGTVYKALDPLLERTVALKTISIAANDPDLADYEARFYLEAKAVGGLNHPNIVTVHDVGNSGTMPYLAMEYVEGVELATLTGEGAPLPVEQALDVAVQVAEGLAYAHARGVIHRDIKPANILLANAGAVKIADFGIARMRSAEAKSEGAGNVIGSPRYMSPEQVLGRRADHRSDIFSFGVMLYEMLTGAPPFSGADLNAILFQIVNLVPPAPSTVNAGVPQMLDHIVAKALAKTPDDRYGSAKELAADLQQCRSKLTPDLRVAGVATPHASALPKIDPYAATPLLSKSFPDARHGDGAAPDVGEATLGLAKDFDSVAAMVRLAAQTGVTETFGRAAGQESPAAEAAMVHGTLIREQSSQFVTGFDRRAGRWNPADKLIFAASVATAAVVAAIIVLT